MSIYEAAGEGDPVKTEDHLYGSSRIGIANKLTVSPVDVPFSEESDFGMTISTFTRGEKNYELSNHLGNVLVTITDKKIRYSASIDDYYGADVVSAVDYFPFGMTMPGRSYSSDGYRYGFNGKERDKDMNSLTAYDYGFRIYNPAIGKFLSVYPLTSDYSELTPYQYASNRPIDGIDLDGLEFLPNNEGLFELQSGEVKIKISNVPSVLKDIWGQPKFDALGVGLAKYGKTESLDGNPCMGPGGGYNAIGRTASWTFSSNDLHTGSYRFSEGTKFKYTNGSGWFTKPFKFENKGLGGSLYSANSVGDGITEMAKYGQMYQDQKSWRASYRLSHSVNTFDKAIKTVDLYLGTEMSTYPAFVKGIVTRDHLVNFVYDGSLPKRTLDDMFDTKTDTRDLQIMYYGMQIIAFNTGVLNFGAEPNWLTGDDYHTTRVGKQTQDHFGYLMDGIQQRMPSANLSSFRKLFEQIKNTQPCIDIRF